MRIEAKLPGVRLEVLQERLLALRVPQLRRLCFLEGADDTDDAQPIGQSLDDSQVDSVELGAQPLEPDVGIP